jgi:hypothetical protein
MRLIGISTILSSLLVLSACATPEPEIITNTEFVERQIPIAPRPAPVDLLNVDFFVVTEENLAEFLNTIENDVGSVVFVAITVQGYENLSINLEELKRFISQQKEVIVYYENLSS